MTTPRFDAGSFRDRESRVFYRDGRVLRALSQPALDDWRALAASSFFDRLQAAGKIVPTRECSVCTAPGERSVCPPPGERRAGEPVAEETAAGEADDDTFELAPPWVAVLEHDRIPYISYPYEWSFSMLRDAALLQLDLLLAALGDDMILKDSSSYNVQWNGPRPVFIDITSFERRTEGDPWAGYLQFCQLFLYPLLLTAHRDIPFRPWLRGAIDGIQPEECNRVFSWRDRLRSGVFFDVYLQAVLHARTADKKSELRDDLRKAGFSKQSIVNNVRRLRKIVQGLSWRRQSSEWSAYAQTSSYDDENQKIKEDFVARAAARRRWPLAWDLGANTGTFSRIVAEHADYVVAFDADHLAVDSLYRSISGDGPDNILPLVSNLADPSPALGWRHRERKALAERPAPRLTLCLALIHHLAITANVPVAEIVDWLASLDTHLVIEFVTKDDAMVRKLLQNKDDIYDDYDIDTFEKLLELRFEILEKQSFHDGTRALYFAGPRGTSP